MYNLDALRRFVSKYGVVRTIETLSNAKFDINQKEQLEAANIFVGGCLNIALIYALSNNLL